jgi:hypothetical protein
MQPALKAEDVAEIALMRMQYSACVRSHQKRTATKIYKACEGHPRSYCMHHDACALPSESGGPACGAQSVACRAKAEARPVGPGQLRTRVKAEAGLFSGRGRGGGGGLYVLK